MSKPITRAAFLALPESDCYSDLLPLPDYEPVPVLGKVDISGTDWLIATIQPKAQPYDLQGWRMHGGGPLEPIPAAPQTLRFSVPALRGAIARDRQMQEYLAVSERKPFDHILSRLDALIANAPELA